jgi:hypothetical protein
VYIIHFYESGYTTLIRFNYWILYETVLPGQGGVPRLAEVDFTDTDTVSMVSAFLIEYCKLNYKENMNMIISYAKKIPTCFKSYLF